MTERDVFRVLFLAFLFLLGTAVGSFLACQTRRMRLSETGKGQKLGRRSVCLKCHYQLKWYDNIPIVSWLALKGRCRKCRRKIGALEIWAEVLTGLAFLMCGGSVVFGGLGPASGGLGLGLTSNGPGSILGVCLENFDVSVCLNGGDLFWLEIGVLVLVLIFVALICFLAIYDGAYGELPVKILTFSIVCAIMIAILEQTGLFLGASGAFGGSAGVAPGELSKVAVSGAMGVVGNNPNYLAGLSGNLLNLAGAVGILGGVYLILYLVSRGKWVGDGDWLLGLALGLVLGDTWLALIVLLLANLLALIASLVQIVAQKPGKLGKLKNLRRTKIYFGPFLVAAFVIVFCFSENFKNMLS